MNAPQKPTTPKTSQQFFRGLMQSLADEAGTPCQRPGGKCLPGSPTNGRRICLWCGRETHRAGKAKD